MTIAAGRAVTLDQGEDVLALSSGLLRLEFRRPGDRWSHHLLDAATMSLLASSVEAAPDPDASSQPTSPSYQELTIHECEASAVALAVGRYGQIHYAATFRLSHHPEGLPTPAAIDGLDLTQVPRGPQTLVEIDVAVRGVGSLGSPAATYVVHTPPARLCWAWESGAGWESDGPFLTLERNPDNPQGHTIQVAERGRVACWAQVVRAPEPSARTLRLIYGWIASDSQAGLCGLGRDSRPEPSGQEIASP